MLVRICRGLPLPYNDCRTSNLELDDENPGRATELEDACVREETARAWPVKRGEVVGMSKGAKFLD